MYHNDQVQRPEATEMHTIELGKIMLTTTAQKIGSSHPNDIRLWKLFNGLFDLFAESPVLLIVPNSRSSKRKV